MHQMHNAIMITLLCSVFSMLGVLVLGAVQTSCTMTEPWEGGIGGLDPHFSTKLGPEIRTKMEKDLSGGVRQI